MRLSVLRGLGYVLEDDVASPEPGTAPLHPQLPDLRQRIGRRVLLSLVLIWAGQHRGAGVSTLWPRRLTALKDRRPRAGACGQAADPPGTPLQLDLTPREVGLLRFDQSETVWFAVCR